MQLATLQSNFRRLAARECECECLTAALLKIPVSLVVLPCWLVLSCGRFERSHCLHLEGHAVQGNPLLMKQYWGVKPVQRHWCCIWCSATGRSRTLLEIRLVSNCCLYSCQQPHLKVTDWQNRAATGLPHQLATKFLSLVTYLGYFWDVSTAVPANSGNWPDSCSERTKPQSRSVVKFSRVPRIA